MKNSRISSRRKMVCFTMIFVPLWKFMALNITQISGPCSLIRQNWDWSMKESYEAMKLLLGKIKYDVFNWKWGGDLKVVALLLGMKLGYTKYCCFVCEWNSRDKKTHYVNKLWPKRTSLTPGEKNVVSPPLVLLEKIYLTPFAHKAGPHERLCERHG